MLLTRGHERRDRKVKNVLQHVESVVRDQLAKACAVHGIDKSEVGYAVGGLGQLTIIGTKQGQMVLPAWTVLMSLRHLLLGQEPVAESFPVPGILPSDTDFRSVVDTLLGLLVATRDSEFRGQPKSDGKIDPEQVIVIPKDKQA